MEYPNKLLTGLSSDNTKIAFKFETVDLSLNESIDTEFITEKNAAYICAKILGMLYPNSCWEFSRLIQRCQELGIKNARLKVEIKNLRQKEEIKPF